MKKKRNTTENGRYKTVFQIWTNACPILVSMVEPAMTSLMAMNVFALLDTKDPTALKVSYVDFVIFFIAYK